MNEVACGSLSSQRGVGGLSSRWPDLWSRVTGVSGIPRGDRLRGCCVG